MRKKLPPIPEPPPEGTALRRDPYTGKLRPFKNKDIEDFSAWNVKNPDYPDWRQDPTYNLRRKK